MQLVEIIFLPLNNSVFYYVLIKNIPFALSRSPSLIPFSLWSMCFVPFRSVHSGWHNEVKRTKFEYIFGFEQNHTFGFLLFTHRALFCIVEFCTNMFRIFVILALHCLTTRASFAVISHSFLPDPITFETFGVCTVSK